MTNENKFFLLSVVAAVLVVGTIVYHYTGTTRSSLPPTPLSNNNSTLPSYTLAEVAQHNTKADCWEIINDKVYNLTQAIDTHPGGPDSVIQFCGQDATQGFMTRNGKGPHSSRAEADLQNFYIGDLKQN